MVASSVLLELQIVEPGEIVILRLVRDRHHPPDAIEQRRPVRHARDLIEPVVGIELLGSPSSCP
jgi:hypothetical protein